MADTTITPTSTPTSPTTETTSTTPSTTIPTQPTTLGKPTLPLSAILPPLIFGTATFNYQYNPDPYELDTAGLVRSALEHGIRAFDTSPYYGPSEEILGSALSTPFVHANFPRSSYFLLTKCGRISSDEFDFSPEHIRASIARSLERLNTRYLDVVYCHDVEFVYDNTLPGGGSGGDSIIDAVRELRRLRDEEGTVKYIGISGYPLPVLCALARRVLAETGEPLDAVMSYANFTLQNSLLATGKKDGVEALREAGVDVVPNASPLGMGLLRREGPPVGRMGNWHPAENGLRAAVRRASDFCDRHDERLEVVAIRYALEQWIRLGSSVGSRGDPASGVPWQRESNRQVGGSRLGVSVMGVSRSAELEKTMQVWRSILDGLEDGAETARLAGRWKRDHEWSLNRQKAVQILADGIQEHLDEYLDFVWESPPKGFVNKLALPAAAVAVDGEDRSRAEEKSQVVGGQSVVPPWMTPAASPQPDELPCPADATLPLR